MNKVALITGGATRLGRAITLHLASRGYNLCIHCNSSTAEAKVCQGLARDLGVEAIIQVANLAQDDAVAKIIPAVNDKLGEISLLINNASVFNPQDFAATDRHQFTADMAVNLKAPFFLTQDFASQVSKKTPDTPPEQTSTQSTTDPLVVNITDGTHSKLTSKHFLYRITKDSLHHFTMMAAKELAPTIRVNGLAPGPALPPPDKDEKHLERVIKSSPLGIASPPETLLHGLDYLISARTVTGQVLYIDSGMHLL